MEPREQTRAEFWAAFLVGAFIMAVAIWGIIWAATFQFEYPTDYNPNNTRPDITNEQPVEA